MLEMADARRLVGERKAIPEISMRKTLILLAIAQALHSQSTPKGICEASGNGKCYYVDTHAGTGPGAFTSPYGLADLQPPNDYYPGKALQDLNPGDVLYFRAGSYPVKGTTDKGYYEVGFFRPARSGTQANPITIRAYPGETVTLRYVSGSNPILGVTPGNNYIRFIGFSVDVSGPATPIAFRIGTPIGGSVGVEIAYNEVIGGHCPLCVTNHDGLFINNTKGIWIHHNNIHGFTAPAPCENSSGIKMYVNTDAMVEDNWIHDNCDGIFDKDSGIRNTYRRNYLTHNSANQFDGNNQGTAATYFIYDNVIDGQITLRERGTNHEIHNNLLRCSNVIAWKAEVTNIKVWNNIVLGGGSRLTTVQTSTQPFTSTPPPIAYFDYNVYDSKPAYAFDLYGSPPQAFDIGSIRKKGFEANSSHSPAGNIFVDNVSYVLKPPYTANGRYGDTMGPKSATIAAILNTARYGPQPK
jgi:hypothetical protein